MEKQFITLDNGAEIAWLERPGHGNTLVLLHGITNNAGTYAALMADIDSNCHIYALDFRGHGDSFKPDSLYDTDAYADDVRHFIRTKVNGPVLLAGHSLGALVATQVASTTPELVTRLFLEDGPFYFVGNMGETYNTLFTALLNTARALQAGTLTAAQCFDMMAAAPDAWTGKPGIEMSSETYIRFRIESLRKLKPKALADALMDSLSWDADAIISQIQCPVTLLNGVESLGSVITAAETERVASLLTDCQVLVQNNVGHLVHEHQPAVWLEAINRWITTDV